MIMLRPAGASDRVGLDDTSKHIEIPRFIQDRSKDQPAGAGGHVTTVDRPSRPTNARGAVGRRSLGQAKQLVRDHPFRVTELCRKCRSTTTF